MRRIDRKGQKFFIFFVFICLSTYLCLVELLGSSGSSSLTAWLHQMVLLLPLSLQIQLSHREKYMCILSICLRVHNVECCDLCWNKS